MTDLARALRRLSFSLPINDPLQASIYDLHEKIMERIKCV